MIVVELAEELLIGKGFGWRQMFVLEGRWQRELLLVLALVLELVYALVEPVVQAEKALVPLQQFLQYAQQ
jgi:hypothetical protein